MSSESKHTKHKKTARTDKPNKKESTASSIAEGSSSRNDGGPLMVNTIGWNYKMITIVHFGEVNKRSKGCKLTVDSGSQFTWVTKKAYKEAFSGTNVKKIYPEKKGCFTYSYDTGNDVLHIKGDLYEDTVSFSDKNIYAGKQFFGIVDEDKLYLQSRDNLRKKNIDGIIGLGSNALDDKTIQKWDVEGKEIKKRFCTLLDNLKAKNRIQENIVGINIGLPYEVTDDYKKKGCFFGELHLGKRNVGTYVEKTMTEIPTVKEGKFAAHYAVQLDLNYGGKTNMDSKGFIDSGCSVIYLPPGFMTKYVEKIRHSAGLGRDVVKYDKNTRHYYLAKKDFRHLGDIKFSFSTGDKLGKASFSFPPTAQVYPPALTYDGFPKLVKNDETVFFVLRDSPANYAILGAPWMMWHYIVLDARKEHKKVGIAEIENRKGHQWTSLS